MGLKYSLIFTDVNMPVMDGIKATKKIRQILLNQFKIETKNQPKIIGVTGHVQEEFKKDALSAGMDFILPKPLYKDDL